MPDRDQQPEARRPAEAELVELRLDGQLSGQRAEEADRLIARDERFKAIAAKQQQIDISLKRLFQPPAVDQAFLQRLARGGAELPAGGAGEPPAPKATLASVAPPAPEAAASPLKPSPLKRWSQLFAVAATLALLVTGGALGWEQLGSLLGLKENPYKRQTVAEVYRQTVDAGFQPDWRCEDDQQFAQTFADRQGQALLLKPLPAGVRMAGLAYLPGLAPNATSMLAHADGEPVLVIVARTEAFSPRQRQPGVSRGVHVFSSEIAGLTLVEVTPLDEPRVLDALYPAEVPPAPTGHVPGDPLP